MASYLNCIFPNVPRLFKKARLTGAYFAARRKLTKTDIAQPNFSCLLNTIRSDFSDPIGCQAIDLPCYYLIALQAYCDCDLIISLTSRMMLCVQLLEPLARHMSVNLRGGNIGMAQ